MPRTKETLLTLTLPLVLLCFSVGSSDLRAHTQAPPPPPTEQKLVVEDATLETFARAYIEISALQVEQQKQAAAAKSEQDKESIQQRANDKMIAVLKDASLEIDTFNAISTSMMQDETLRARVNEIIAEINKQAAKEAEKEKQTKTQPRGEQ